MFFFSAALIGVSFIILSMSKNIILSTILTVIIFGFGFTRRVLFSHYMNKYIESNNRATVLSAISMVETFGRAIIYPIIGLIMQYSINIATLIVGILILIISLFSKVEENHLID